FMQLVINHGLGAAANLDFRRALAHAIDSESLNNAFYNGRYLNPGSHLTPASWAYREMANWPRYDMAKAQELMERSGIPVEERFMWVAPSNSTSGGMLQAIARSWEDLGVT